MLPFSGNGSADEDGGIAPHYYWLLDRGLPRCGGIACGRTGSGIVHSATKEPKARKAGQLFPASPSRLCVRYADRSSGTIDLEAPRGHVTPPARRPRVTSQPLTFPSTPDDLSRSRHNAEAVGLLSLVHVASLEMPPSAMVMPVQSVPGVPMSAGGVDPVFWGQDFSSASTSPLSPSLGLHLSPTTSVTTQGSFNGSTPPMQTPPSESGKKSSQNGHKSSQKEANGNQTRASVAVACVPCRSRHLKCDGGARCSRCKTDNVDCTYIKSRRGWKGKKKNKEENAAPVTLNGACLQPPQRVELNLLGLATAEVALSNGHLSSPEYSYGRDIALMNQLSPTHSLGARPVAPPVAPPVAQINLNGTARLNRFGHLGPEDAVQAFFHFFYNSHPFCLPEPRLIEVLKERQAPLLEYAVQFIGSSFMPAVSTEMYKEALDRHINNGNFPRDAWSVQALMLFAIGLHAHNEVPRAAQVFIIAQTLTLELGLNRMEFALVHGENDPQLEESWRRTWWSMFTVNGMMTAVNPGVQFRLKDVVTDVPLPCEDDQYFSGVSDFLTSTSWQFCTSLCGPFTQSCRTI